MKHIHRRGLGQRHSHGHIRRTPCPLSFLPFLLPLLLLCPTAQSKPVRPDQAALLMQLKAMWQKMVDLSSWDPDKDCGAWGYRVRCGPDGSVT